MQFRPRFTSACMSPCVATTWPCLTPTITPQPVPQNRQGAFDHLISSAPTPPGTGCAAAGSAMPAVAAAMPAAWAFRMSRRVSSPVIALSLLRFDMLKNHIRRDDPVEKRYPRKAFSHHPCTRPLYDDDNLPTRMPMDFDVFHPRNLG